MPGTEINIFYESLHLKKNYQKEIIFVCKFYLILDKRLNLNKSYQKKMDYNNIFEYQISWKQENRPMYEDLAIQR